MYLPRGSKSCNGSAELEQCRGLDIKSQSKTLLREGQDCAIMKFLQEFPPVSHWLAEGFGLALLLHLTDHLASPVTWWNSYYPGNLVKWNDREPPELVEMSPTSS